MFRLPADNLVAFLRSLEVANLRAIVNIYDFSSLQILARTAKDGGLVLPNTFSDLRTLDNVNINKTVLPFTDKSSHIC